MKRLGENKLFEIALKYWGISIREAFERFEEVEYKIDSTKFDYVEELFFYSAKNSEVGLFSLRHVITLSSEYFYIRRLDGSYDTFFQAEIEDANKADEEELEPLDAFNIDPCEDCICYNCSFMGHCTPCLECCLHEESFLIFECDGFIRREDKEI